MCMIYPRWPTLRKFTQGAGECDSESLAQMLKKEHQFTCTFDRSITILSPVIVLKAAYQLSLLSFQFLSLALGFQLLKFEFTTSIKNRCVN
jgi:hypothetical protein